jgi:hypothetical protein
VLSVVFLACHNPATQFPGLVTETPGSAEISPTNEAIIPTMPFGEAGVQPKLNFLADPNTACVWHRPTARLLDYSNYSLTDITYILTCLDGDGWHVYTLDDFGDQLYLDLPNSRTFYPPNWIVPCPDGRVFLKMGYVYLLENGLLFQVTRRGSDPISPDNFACGRNADFWFSENRNIYHFDGRDWTEYPENNFLGSGSTGEDRVNFLAVAPDGELWVITTNSIATFDGAAWQVFEAGKDFDKTPSAEELVIDTNGIVWLSSGTGLLKYDGIKWSAFPSPDDVFIHFMALDRENRIWVVDSRNFYLFDPPKNRWDLQFDMEELSGAAINSVQVDGQGRLWVATNYGLAVHADSGWTVYHTYSADLYSNIVEKLIVFGDGPQLPALMLKEPGSIHGRLVNSDPTIYENKQVEICLKDLTSFHGKTPCEDQAFHAVTTVDIDGNFTFTNIPVGKYFLMIQRDENSWFRYVYFEVVPGALTEFGDFFLRCGAGRKGYRKLIEQMHCLPKSL